MKEFRRTSRSFIAFSSVILFAALLVSCSNTEQYTKKIDELEKEKIALESRIKGLESLQQQAITAKDTEIAKLKELNTTLDAQVKELQKQSSRSDNQVTGRKLSQDNAEKAIKALASSYGFDLRGGGNGCSFRVQSIAAIQLSQFSDNEATADVLLKCARGGLVMKFVFQKDVDNQWFLMKIASTSPGYQVDYDAIAPYQNLKMRAQ